MTAYGLFHELDLITSLLAMGDDVVAFNDAAADDNSEPHPFAVCACDDCGARREAAYLACAELAPENAPEAWVREISLRILGAAALFTGRLGHLEHGPRDEDAELLATMPCLLCGTPSAPSVDVAAVLTRPCLVCGAIAGSTDPSVASRTDN